MPAAAGRNAAVILDREVTAPPSGFPDTAGNEHEAAIDVVADRQIAQGRTDGTYDPEGDVRRDQMGSFLARTLQAVLDEGGNRALTPLRR